MDSFKTCDRSYLRWLKMAFKMAEVRERERESERESERERVKTD